MHGTVQFNGLEVSAFTRRLAEGRTVRLEFEGSRKDRFDRRRAYVYLDDGALLNADLIREGYGFVYTLAPFSRMEQFRELERDARTAGRGMWAPAGASSGSGPIVDLAAMSAPLEQRRTRLRRCTARRPGPSTIEPAVGISPAGR
jgi:micrococcal nuclease